MGGWVRHIITSIISPFCIVVAALCRLSAIDLYCRRANQPRVPGMDIQASLLHLT